MKTDMTRVKTWSRPLGLAAAALAMTLWGAGCGNPECRDEFDCREQGAPPAGQVWTCEEEKCVAKPVETPPEEDAGTGTDAGTQVDAGTDAGTQVDAGTDAGTQVDAGTDAGTQVDAGTDAGTDPCATASYDAKLGTLKLQTGFAVAESAALPTDVLAVAATPGPTYSLYAARATDTGADLYSFGDWPDVRLDQTSLYNLVAPADRDPGTMVFPGSYLVTDGKRLLTGYTKPDESGSVAVYEIAAPASSSYLAATGNFSGAVTGDVFLVNGKGLGTVGGSTLGVYALETDKDPFTAVQVVTMPSNALGSGFSAVANNGVAVFGYYGSGANQLHAVPPVVLSTARTSGTPVALENQPKLDLGSNASSAAAFGDGVAVVRGNFDSSFNFIGIDVARYPLSFGIGGGSTVTIGARAPVLTFADQCTRVQDLTPMGADVLVTLRDKNGRRLVRIQQAP